MTATDIPYFCDGKDVYVDGARLSLNCGHQLGLFFIPQMAYEYAA
jgi:hypothetical protein